MYGTIKSTHFLEPTKEEETKQVIDKQQKTTWGRRCKEKHARLQW